MEGGDDSLTTLFSETGTGMHLPRVIFVELNPAMVDELDEGPPVSSFNDRLRLRMPLS
jgi:tubulin alpha